MPENLNTLEQGDIFIFYQPKVQQKNPDSEADIRRFYMVLIPDQKQKYRLMVIGQKELPEPNKAGQQRYWGYVLMISETPEQIRNELGSKHYSTKTRGERFIQTARPSGEGVYRIVNHNGHTHLIYSLELPKKNGEVHDELNIEQQASYIITVKNPQVESPVRVGLSQNRNANYPQYLQNKFGDKRFSELDPVDFLDYEGSEFILISSSEDIKEELGIELKTDDESMYSADIFSKLKLDRSNRPSSPLFKGEWK